MEGFAKLGFNPAVLLAQVINFGVLFVLLWVFGLKTFTRIVDQRSKRIKESLEAAEAMKAHTASAEAEVKKQLEEASRQGQAVIERAVKAGDDMREKAKDDARKEAETLISRARADIQAERDEAIGQVRREFADLTIMAAEKVVERSLDKKAHKELIDKVLQESDVLKG